MNDRPKHRSRREGLRRRYTIPVIGNLVCWIRNNVVTRPALYFSYFRLRGKHLELAVNESTDIVMDGFGGSANTFAHRAFQSCQVKPVCIAHHLHVPAQIIRGLDLGKPVLVYVRDPISASISGLSRYFTKYDEKTLYTALRNRLRNYIVFYSAVLPHKDQFVVAPFEEVITDFGAIIRRVNEKFGTDFGVFEHTDENVNLVKANLARAKPGTVRLNDPVRLREILNSPELEPLRDEAYKLHRAMLD